MLSRKHLLIFSALVILVSGFIYLPSKELTQHLSPNRLFHHVHGSGHSEPLRNPIDSGQYFLLSTVCAGCHGYDSTHLANIDINGKDVNVFDDWRSTMMANSAKDPLWRAKVHHEILVDPVHSGELQTKCTSCHAPMGHFTAIYNGATEYTLDSVMHDSLALEGVSCTSCHEIGTDGLGSRFSGDIPYDTTKKEYGPFDNPLTGPMNLYVGLTPTFSEHMSQGRLCSSCHTLITKTADLNGNYTGGTFTEQATFHEWKNSVYPSQGTICQSCHMPQLEEPIVIANQIISLQPRSPFNLHIFAGANYFILNMLKNNKTALGITVGDMYFDSTLNRTQALLQTAVNLSLHTDSVTQDTAYFSLDVTNKAGHKFPSGYPSRRAVVQFIVLKTNGDTLFRSGIYGNNGEVLHIDSPFEHHHNVINNQTETQVYEMIMGDVNSDKTTVLERSANLLKDNRIPPNGFTTSFYDYDTTQIAGEALTDPDFNKTGLVEGSGKDVVHYHVPSLGYTGQVNVYVNVFYQSVPPAWLNEMFAYTDSLIDVFKQMYQAMDKAPMNIASDQLLNIQLYTGNKELALNNQISIYPVPSLNGRVNVAGRDITVVEVYDITGKRISKNDYDGASSINNVQLPDERGIYLIKVYTGSGIQLFKAMRL